jgi:hypothetical protein
VHVGAPALLYIMSLPQSVHPTLSDFDRNVPALQLIHDGGEGGGVGGAGDGSGVGTLAPHPAAHWKHVLQQDPIIHEFALLSHLPHDFCCAQL